LPLRWRGDYRDGESTLAAEQESDMAVKPIPDGYHSVQPYLVINGAAKAIEFYKKAFGATERFAMKQPDGRIGHAELEIGDSCIMMADENAQMEAFAPSHYGGSPVSLMIYTEDCDRMYKQAIAAGATSDREPADQFYGDRMAGVRDPFGYKWYIATHIKDVSKEDMEKAQ
jgi:PhnB protein